LNSNVTPSISTEAILQVAAKLFREKGYRATSLEDVAAHFKVSRQALYHYFTSKQEILTTIHRRVGEKLYTKAWELFDEPLPVDQKMKLLMQELIIVAATEATNWGIFYEEEKEINSEYLREVKAKRREYTEKLIELYIQGVREKVFNDLDPKIAVFSLLGACNWVYRWFKQDGTMTSKEIADITVQILANGYLTRTTT